MILLKDNPEDLCSFFKFILGLLISSFTSSNNGVSNFRTASTEIVLITLETGLLNDFEDGGGVTFTAAIPLALK